MGHLCYSLIENQGWLIGEDFWKNIPVGIYLLLTYLAGMNKSEQTRAFIIEKTAPIFNKKGYVGTSLTDMTEATMLTKGSIYGNFANKDEVALAAFDYNLEKVKGIIRHEMLKYHSAKDKLLVYGKVYTQYTLHPFPLGGCPILNTAIEADDTHPQLRKRVSGAINGWKKKIISIVEAGIDAKEFNRKTNPEQVALTIIALIEGGIMIAKISNKPEQLRIVMNSLKAFVEQIT